jgi:hypothetical protein
VTHPFGGQTGKLPVRGQIRITQMLVCSALMVNLRRMWRYEQQLANQRSEQSLSLLCRCWLHLRHQVHGWYARCVTSLGPATAQV